jgi:hypothetical protein
LRSEPLFSRACLCSRRWDLGVCCWKSMYRTGRAEGFRLWYCIVQLLKEYGRFCTWRYSIWRSPVWRQDG